MWIYGVSLPSPESTTEEQFLRFARFAAPGTMIPGIVALLITKLFLREDWRTTTLNTLGIKRYSRGHGFCSRARDSDTADLLGLGPRAFGSRTRLCAPDAGECEYFQARSLVRLPAARSDSDSCRTVDERHLARARRRTGMARIPAAAFDESGAAGLARNDRYGRSLGPLARTSDDSRAIPWASLPRSSDDDSILYAAGSHLWMAAHCIRKRMGRRGCARIPRYQFVRLCGCIGSRF